MSISFRFADAAEIPEVARLLVHSFPGVKPTPEAWEHSLQRTDYGDGPEIVWVGAEGGRIVAACQMHRLREWVAGSALSTMGLGTVAIAPTHRQRGLAGRLVAGALRAARERGDVASALFPFRVSFYARLGYGLAGEALQYLVPPDALPSSEERDRVELASDASLAEVRAFYDRWARTQTGQVERAEQVWARMLEPANRALLLYRGGGGRVEGYALLVYRTDLPPRERYLEVDELVWESTAARRGLYGWLSTLGDQWWQILLRALPEHRLGEWLGEPRLPWGSAPGWKLWFPSATLLRGPMFRLLDLDAAWAARGVHPDARLTVELEAQDGILEENAGRRRLRLEGGRVVVERGGGGGAADLTLRADVQGLSRIFIGAIPPSAAVQADLASVDRPERLPELDRALRLPEPWTFDRF